MAKLTDKDKQRAYELYKEGMTDAQIAAHFGITPPAVFQWRHACGLPANGKKLFGKAKAETPEQGIVAETPEAPVFIAGSPDYAGNGGLGATGFPSELDDLKVRLDETIETLEVMRGIVAEAGQDLIIPAIRVCRAFRKLLDLKRLGGGHETR